MHLLKAVFLQVHRTTVHCPIYLYAQKRKTETKDKQKYRIVFLEGKNIMRIHYRRLMTIR